jgi:hypothetical protein
MVRPRALVITWGEPFLSQTSASTLLAPALGPAFESAKRFFYSALVYGSLVLVLALCVCTRSLTVGPLLPPGTRSSTRVSPCPSRRPCVDSRPPTWRGEAGSGRSRSRLEGGSFAASCGAQYGLRLPLSGRAKHRLWDMNAVYIVERQIHRYMGVSFTQKGISCCLHEPGRAWRKGARGPLPTTPRGWSPRGSGGTQPQYALPAVTSQITAQATS